MKHVRYYHEAPAGIDPGRGSFKPTERKSRGPLRPGKTRQDRMPVEKRPRVTRLG
jgi:hypothetical protein